MLVCVGLYLNVGSVFVGGDVEICFVVWSWFGSIVVG